MEEHVQMVKEIQEAKGKGYPGQPEELGKASEK